VIAAPTASPLVTASPLATATTTDPLTAPITQGNVVSNLMKFLHGAWQTVWGGTTDPGHKQDLGQMLGGQLTNDLTAIGTFTKELKQGNDPIGSGNQVTPDVKGSGHPLGQQDTNKPADHKWTLPDKH
jgi:hypothetical protein